MDDALRGDRVPEDLVADLLGPDDRLLVGRLLESRPSAARALPLVERWRDRVARGDDEAADRWLELMHDAERALAEGELARQATLTAASAEWDVRA
ncbi:MAG TPA: hypothetical protein VLB86_03190 [Gaiellaceae bacterium]|nr:hypothetical protein [Gaiellaceae bacterium]